MIPTLLGGILLGQENPLLRPQQGIDPLRLAITPIADGVVSDQEWDQFTETEGGPTFFQWEPGKLYWGAKPRPGFDVVLSLDTNGDGWLVGDDNLEIRVTMNGDSTKTTVRQLDATDRNGPIWVVPRVLPDSIKVAGKPSTAYWNLEGSFNAEGFSKEIKEDSRVGVRVDVLPTDADTGPSYLPRNLQFLRLRFDKSRNLFSGLVWKPGISNRNVARLDPLNFKFNFTVEEDCPMIQSVDIVGEGYARDAINQVTLPFPGLDRRGNASLNYSSEIKNEAVGGYRVLRATVLAADGQIAQIRTSFRIADLLDFEFGLPKSVRYSDEAQVIKGTVTLRSQGTGRMDGTFDYVLPETWSSRRGKAEKFLIYFSRGNAKINVEYSIPGGTVGTFPITLTANVGEQNLSKTFYVQVK